ncbi:hypothetical protein QEG98_37835 [Myxococcus sp. MxC21-1]|uniref:hypothetical protein n=1 Tax=Myxococcus sp. MxC21-1 TaxID=3041439 RepID=UPI00292CC666|nr:hypothetical protein [Myxococcus sp. MxC21-1]WNZ61564.1 hypothetical protein QEG98_37835 [Myxococcus sp. MxC21-1]
MDAARGHPQDDLALGAAVDASGDLLTLSLHDIDDLDSLQPTDNRAKLVLTRRAPTGEPRWQKSFDVRAPEVPLEVRAFVRGRIAADPAGGIVIAGTTEGVLDLLSHKLGDGTFVVRMDADGNVLWTNTPAGTGLAVADRRWTPRDGRWWPSTRRAARTSATASPALARWW